MCGGLAFMGTPLAAAAAARPARRHAASPTRPPPRMADDGGADGADGGVEADAAAAPPPEVVRPKTVSPPKSSATWANVWLPQFPRKGAGSVIGWDLRPSTLREEDRSGVCDLCRGTGSTVCTICNGNSFMGPSGPVECKGCRGKVTVQCGTCYGSGKQVDIVGEWWKVDFSKFLRK
jgi:hypothetical protein